MRNFDQRRHSCSGVGSDDCNRLPKAGKGEASVDTIHESADGARVAGEVVSVVLRVERGDIRQKRLRGAQLRPVVTDEEARMALGDLFDDSDEHGFPTGRINGLAQGKMACARHVIERKVFSCFGDDLEAIDGKDRRAGDYGSGASGEFEYLGRERVPGGGEGGDVVEISGEFDNFRVRSELTPVAVVGLASATGEIEKWRTIWPLKPAAFDERPPPFGLHATSRAIEPKDWRAGLDQEVARENLVG